MPKTTDLEVISPEEIIARLAENIDKPLEELNPLPNARYRLNSNTWLLTDEEYKAILFTMQSANRNFKKLREEFDEHICAEVERRTDVIVKDTEWKDVLHQIISRQEGRDKDA